MGRPPPERNASAGGPKCIAKHKGVANPLSQVKKTT